MLHMEQKDYKLEVLLALLKEQNHVRGIAKLLNVNHMLVSRKIKEPLSYNVVDYRQEGKNKVYFIKKTIESRAYVFMAEHYKLVQLIYKYPDLRRCIDKIQKDKRIKLAILFGSFAKGLAKKQSDIDVFIESKGDIKRDLALIDSRLSIKTGKYDKSNTMIKEIEKNHVVLKGIEVFYEKNKFFD